MITLLTSGSGCGKSTYAEKLIARMEQGKRYYIATMQVYDEESIRRVARHRAQRADKGFETIECPKELKKADVPQGSVVLLEDIPNLLANEMFDGGDWTRIVPDILNLAEKCSHLVIVTNDIFSDGIIYEEMTQEYICRNAFINKAVAAAADRVIEVVYSIPVILKGEAPCV